MLGICDNRGTFMNIYDMSIKDVKIIEPDIHKDHRGYLCVPISVKPLREFGIDFNILQINQGYSIKPHTIRGMHFQSGEHAQAKLVSANWGSFYSVAVDIRKDSPTFGKWCGEVISRENCRVMYIPRGFAHGYLTMEKDTVLQYSVDNDYCAAAAKALRYDDALVGITWPCEIDITTLAEKDINALTLKEISEGEY